MNAALEEDPRPGVKPKLDAKGHGFLVALACSTPPLGREVWTLELLSDRLVALDYVESFSGEAVRRALKKTNSSRGGTSSGPSPRRSPNAETRRPLPPRHDKLERFDYEYERQGTANVFMLVAPRLGWRQVNVTEQRTRVDFTWQMRLLVDDYFPQAITIRVVLDKLNAHNPADLYEAFAPPKPSASWIGWSSSTCPSTPVG